jgi:hypothetical protein
MSKWMYKYLQVSQVHVGWTLHHSKYEVTLYNYRNVTKFASHHHTKMVSSNHSSRSQQSYHRKIQLLHFLFKRSMDLGIKLDFVLTMQAYMYQMSLSRHTHLPPIIVHKVISTQTSPSLILLRARHFADNSVSSCVGLRATQQLSQCKYRPKKTGGRWNHHFYFHTPIINFENGLVHKLQALR